jgi:hypothetical protein
MRHRLTCSALLATLGGLLLAPSAAVADCQPAGSVEEALATTEIAFVGTVITSAEGRSGAGFRVEEVWVGSVGETVELHGMGAGDELMEDDRHWQAGARYLVIPYVEGGRLRDHLCTATTEWRPELAELRPAGATTVAPATESGGVPVILLVLGGLLALGLAAFAVGPRISGRPTRGG